MDRDQSLIKYKALQLNLLIHLRQSDEWTVGIMQS